MRFIFGRPCSGAVATATVLALATLGAAPALPQEQQHDANSRRLKLLEGPEQMLSVDETLGIVFDPTGGFPRRKYYARANPKAEDALYRILANES